MISMFRILNTPMVLTLAILTLALGAQAQDAVSTQNESSTTTKAKAPAPPQKDVDEEITNARLRASTGSKKRYSLQTAFNYNGGSIESPLSKVRPRLTPGTIYQDPAKLTGSISGKYRMTDYDNLNLGIGVGWLTPSYSGQRGQLENPYVSYSRVFKAGRIQNVMGLGFTKYTADQAVDSKKMNFAADASYTAVTSFSTGTDAGFSFAYSQTVYSEFTGNVKDFAGVYPFVEQALNDKLSLRTVFRIAEFYNTTADTRTWTRDDPTQSFGVGISVARDLYLYPNVQWVWGDMRAEKTNVALSANINL